MKAIAAESLGNIGGAGLGPFSNLGSAGAAAQAFTKTISSIIGIITIAATIWFMFQLFIGGVGWLASGGDKTKLEGARSRITNAFIGLIIVVAAWGIIALMGQFLGGYDILLPENIIDKIRL